MIMRTLLLGLCTAATSLVLADGFLAHAESLQEKLEASTMPPRVWKSPRPRRVVKNSSAASRTAKPTASLL